MNGTWWRSIGANCIPPRVATRPPHTRKERVCVKTFIRVVEHFHFERDFLHCMCWTSIITKCFSNTINV